MITLALLCAGTVVSGVSYYRQSTRNTQATAGLVIGGLLLLAGFIMAIATGQT